MKILSLAALVLGVSIPIEAARGGTALWDNSYTKSVLQADFLSKHDVRTIRSWTESALLETNHPKHHQLLNTLAARGVTTQPEELGLCVSSGPLVDAVFPALRRMEVQIQEAQKLNSEQFIAQKEALLKAEQNALLIYYGQSERDMQRVIAWATNTPGVEAPAPEILSKTLKFLTERMKKAETDIMTAERELTKGTPVAAPNNRSYATVSTSSEGGAATDPLPKEPSLEAPQLQQVADTKWYDQIAAANQEQKRVTDALKQILYGCFSHQQPTPALDPITSETLLKAVTPEAGFSCRQINYVYNIRCGGDLAALDRNPLKHIAGIQYALANPQDTSHLQALIELVIKHKETLHQHIPEALINNAIITFENNLAQIEAHQRKAMMEFVQEHQSLVRIIGAAYTLTTRSGVSPRPAMHVLDDMLAPLRATPSSETDAAHAPAPALPSGEPQTVRDPAAAPAQTAKVLPNPPTTTYAAAAAIIASGGPNAAPTPKSEHKKPK